MSTCRRSSPLVCLVRSTEVKTRAFTLIEVLAVVAIIALLISILLPSLVKARKQAKRTVCLSNLHQLSIALYSYQAEHKGKPPQWPVGLQSWTDPICLWAGGPSPVGFSTRLGQLYPKYIGKQENVYFCPEALGNALLNGYDKLGAGLTYGWANWGKNWTYGSYEYRPYWHQQTGKKDIFIGGDLFRRRGRAAIASDGFSGWWHGWGQYPSHSPITDAPKELHYNVAYVDGGANQVKDPRRQSTVDPFGPEFQTRAPSPAQADPWTITETRPGGLGTITVSKEYTMLPPVGHQPLPPKNGTAAEKALRAQILSTEAHIERGWGFFDRH